MVDARKTTYLHVGNVGSVIQVTVRNEDAVYDISTATTKKFIFIKPTGVSVIKDAAFVNTGTDGLLKYTTLAGDLDVDGTWRIQVYIEISGKKFYSDVTDFVVSPNLAVITVTP